ncbi:3-hydroxyanthranilate 3,4-dioxygenase [Stenotrophomonas mori]|uniref:3-hydroxyanthranilate 3,4-dioxygenase n=1 Tax=Stenotrophomonas mori TaxID=2871096 RepID=A0ABT0SF66_9GAMM|nr:3-hydroxyanthranilate 3,4-dioxygenase [Stenotrophomonas mori]MCL7713965.1 3-hydroxyanthranilate 3,4-dioxygenase [Stenotrophomonas mori]
MLASPINLQAWIEEHRHLLRPPVGNRMIDNGDFIVMVVGGPNTRTDFHYDEGPEWFYQLEGEMVLKVQEDGAVRDIPIRAGEIFLLPPRVPHSPRRPAGSVGLVVERKRLAHELDGVAWHCEQCNHKLHEEFFHLGNIETDLPRLFERFHASLAHRTCGRCGALHPLPPGSP